jgi:hypothetical protein
MMFRSSRNNYGPNFLPIFRRVCKSFRALCFSLPLKLVIPRLRLLSLTQIAACYPNIAELVCQEEDVAATDVFGKLTMLSRLQSLEMRK